MNPTPQQIRQTRKNAGLSMAEVADLMGVTRMTVHNWESGKHPMKPRDFEYLKWRLFLVDRDKKATP